MATVPGHFSRTFIIKNRLRKSPKSNISPAQFTMCNCIFYVYIIAFVRSETMYKILCRQFSMYTLLQPSGKWVTEYLFETSLESYAYIVKRLFSPNVRNVLLNYPVDSQGKYVSILYFLGVGIISGVFRIRKRLCILLT